MRRRYKGIEVNAFGIPVGFLPKQRKNKEVRSKRAYLRSFSMDLKKGAPKNLLVIYDIPHARKRERDWFRRQLKNFDFVMIQKSAWVGPSPLPEDFRNYLKRIGLEKDFKTFKLSRPYVT